jgi:predicted protein tyrosine phosphatase
LTTPPTDHIVITGRSRAGRILCSPTECAAVAYLVSIGSPTEREPAGFRNVARRIRLVFEDAPTQDMGGASIDDIEQLVHFAREVDLQQGRLLVHCQSGISRSSAAAAIVLAVALGPGREKEAIEYLRTVQPAARPNKRMLELADTLLRAEGRLAAGAS